MPYQPTTPPGTYFSRYLSSDGTAAGTKNANGNYATPTHFYIQPVAGTVLWIARLLVSVEDTTGFTSEEYGNLGSALTNGITVTVNDTSGTIIDLTDNVPVKANSHWGRLCYDVDVKNWGNTPTDELLVARWTFTNAGKYLQIPDNSNARLSVILNDNLTGLVSHYFLAQGFTVT